MPVVALEGSSFSGKTTVAKLLGSRFSAPVIGEYIDYAPNGLPPFATTDAELVEQIDFYVGLESARKRDLLSAAALTIVDRTAASLVAFQRAQQRLTAGGNTRWDPQGMEDRIRQSNALGRVIVPELVLVLSAGSKEEHDARVWRRGAIGIKHLVDLNDWGFSEALRRDTVEALGTLFPATPVKEYVTAGDPHAIADIVADVQNIIGIQET